MRKCMSWCEWNFMNQNARRNSEIYVFESFKFALLKGTVLYCLVVVPNRSAAVHYITAFMVSFPMSMLITLLAILLNMTTNQRMFSKLLSKLNYIHIILFKYDGTRTNKWLKVEMCLVLFILNPWLCVDSWLWVHRKGFGRRRNSNDTFGNRTRDLPVCRVVP
jgi:hypothetical protein